MKDGPPVADSSLQEAIQAYYDPEVDKTTFRAKGWGGYSYLAGAGGQTRYFIKLQNDETLTEGVAAGSSAFYLPLLDQLHRKSIVPIPELVLPESGGFSVHLDGFEISVYRFVQGKTIGFGRMPDDVFAELAGLVGRLHAGTGELTFTDPFHDTFWMDAAQQVMEILDGLPHNLEPGAGMLREKILPHHERLKGCFEKMENLQAYALKAQPAQVVCHTDLHGANLMRDEAGRLLILDWDNALLAPPEHDLFAFIGDPRFEELFVPNYERAFGPMQLEPKLVAFYVHRRAFEDILGFVPRILDGSGSPQRDEEDLAETLGMIDWMVQV